MTTTRPRHDGPAPVFSRNVVQVGAAPIHYLEAGQGATVLVLREDAKLTPSLFDTLLADTCRVIVVGMPRAEQAAPRDAARLLMQTVTALSLNNYVLVSTTVYAQCALWQTLDTPQGIEGLVLLSPPVVHSEGQTSASNEVLDAAVRARLSEIQTPTLVVYGTNARALPADAGQRYVERLASCYYTLLYDAGHDPGTDRPHALTVAVRDFIERRGAFIVEQASTALNP